MKVKGRIMYTSVYWFMLSIDNYEIESRNVYKKAHTARAAAEKLAKKLNLVIEWEK